MTTPTLRVAHLYGDIMNIYGDWGNIAAFTYRAQQRGLKVQVETVTLGQTIRPQHYHFYFFGGGQDEGQRLVADHLVSQADALKRDVDSGVPLLSVCGGYQLLGHSYTTGDNQVLPGAKILPVTTTAGPVRAMNNIVVAINPQLDIDRTAASTLVGFENHSGRTQLLDQAVPLGRVIKGYGNNGQDATEGVVHHHAIGTYLHGSCLPKNPHLADWFLSKALMAANLPSELIPLDDAVEWQAHQFAVHLKP